MAKTYLLYNKSTAVRSEGLEDPQINTESFTSHFLLEDSVLKLPAQPETKEASPGRNQGLELHAHIPQLSSTFGSYASIQKPQPTKDKERMTCHISPKAKALHGSKESHLAFKGPLLTLPQQHHLFLFGQSCRQEPHLPISRGHGGHLQHLCKLRMDPDSTKLDRLPWLQLALSGRSRDHRATPGSRGALRTGSLPATLITKQAQRQQNSGLRDPQAAPNTGKCGKIEASSQKKTNVFLKVISHSLM